MAVNSFTGRYDPNEPPHMVDSSDAFILEIHDRNEWDAPQRHFAEWVETHIRSGLMPYTAPIEDMAPYLGSMHKLAVVDGGADFAYRIYGEKIKDAANLDLQSKTVSGLIEPARSAFLDHYRDLLENPRLFVGTVRYAGLIRAHPVWHRCAVPAGSDTVEGFFVLTYPSAGSARL